MPRLSLAKLERHLYAAADRLRQEGLDAATYKDYIFGMLFLKRCSDVFEAENEQIIGRRVEEGMELQQAKKAYGENPDYYDGFFVPERARWLYLVERLNDATEAYGSVLEQDHIEAVIGLPPNLFYGAGIPACILVMRPNLTGQSPNPNKPAERRGKVLFINADAEFHAGRAQKYLRPEHIEKIVSTFDRFNNVPAYARVVPIAEIAGEANDFNLNIRRYVDNSPPPEPHDVRAHLLGGVPVAEIDAKSPLFDALGFDPRRLFVIRSSITEGVQFQNPQSPIPNPQSNPSQHSGYQDFTSSIADRSAIRPVIETDPGLQQRTATLRSRLTRWWTVHSPRLADLPKGRDLNRVRAEFLESFVTNVLEGNGQPPLDRFKLAGVIATWWNDTLPDFKTLLENGFPGVIDGWVDAIADAVEDDEAASPAFDPFGHKLVRRVMEDYLERSATAKADIARLKGEKEAFEQSNPPDDAEEEEAWNYAKDLARQIRELKSEHKAALKELARLEKQASKHDQSPNARRAAAAAPSPGGEGRGEGECKARLITLPGAASNQPVAARKGLQPVLDQLAALEAALVPYEQIRSQLAEARARYHTLTDEFVNELQSRCDTLKPDQKRALVLELFAQDILAGLDSALAEKRQDLVRFVEGLWDKYAVPMESLVLQRVKVSERLANELKVLGYGR